MRPCEHERAGRHRAAQAGALHTRSLLAPDIHAPQAGQTKDASSIFGSRACVPGPTGVAAGAGAQSRLACQCIALADAWAYVPRRRLRRRCVQLHGQLGARADADLGRGWHQRELAGQRASVAGRPVRRREWRRQPGQQRWRRCACAPTSLCCNSVKRRQRRRF